MKTLLSFLGLFLCVASGDQNRSNVSDELPSLCVLPQKKEECYSFWVHNLCLSQFRINMNNFSNVQWCAWDQARSFYDKFTMCTEEYAEQFKVAWPNQLVENTFVEIHTEYFQPCLVTEFSDPPPSVVFALVMTPICLIPVIVLLVVLKTKNGDGAP